ncbi:hypothetical protein ABZP36_008713 [Zizania latifolia]
MQGLSANKFYKLNWDQVDDNIQSWLTAAHVAFSSLFPAEKELYGSVFAGNESVGDAVLAAIADDQATSLLSVTENAVARARRAPERLFRVLDVHDLLTEVLPEILSVFGDRSEVAKRACSALLKAGEAARGALTSLETAIQKEPTKATTAGGGARAQAAAQRHLDAYVLAAWGKVLKAITAADGVEAAVVEAVATQERWVAADEEMGEALRAAATATVVPMFRMFYRRHGAAVRLTPGDVNAMIGGLFAGLATDSSC